MVLLILILSSIIHFNHKENKKAHPFLFRILQAFYNFMITISKEDNNVIQPI